MTIYKQDVERQLAEKDAEIEKIKRKMNTKVAEVEEQIDQAAAKNLALEKSKSQMRQQMDQLMGDLDKEKMMASQVSKMEMVIVRRCFGLSSQLVHARRGQTQTFKHISVILGQFSRLFL